MPQRNRRAPAAWDRHMKPVPSSNSVSYTALRTLLSPPGNAAARRPARHRPRHGRVPCLPGFCSDTYPHLALAAGWRGNRFLLLPIGSTVDVKAASYRAIGSPSLATNWTDPDFDRNEATCYYGYVPVIPMPTPRWTTYDAKFFSAERRSSNPFVRYSGGPLPLLDLTPRVPTVCGHRPPGPWAHCSDRRTQAGLHFP